MKALHHIVWFCLAFGLATNAFGQLSPGELSAGHADLEGLSNCTKCHTIGAKVTDQKCLDCHKEIDQLIELDRGYHASKEVKGKTCVDCHSEHHGKKFEPARFDQEAFDHELTGYALEGSHQKIECRDCHKPDYIVDNELRKRPETFLGMEQACLNCHEDFHQETLSDDCAQCHNIEKFRPAPKFNHEDAQFKLRGAHKEVDCIDCHKETTRNGKAFQEFTGIPFQQCTNCHKDEHNGAFGSNCTECHNINSWKGLKEGVAFNHDKTDFPLVGLHQKVDCRECHTSGRNTDPLPHQYCKDCHEDYHNNQFTSQNPKSDCQDCHTEKEPFTYSKFSLEDHDQSAFQLKGAHVATPCFACHVSEDRWEFRNIGERCVDCHTNIHENFISTKFYPEQDCESCHNSDNWSSISFDHTQTDWPLEGAHNNINCRACHFEKEKGIEGQHFNNLQTTCVTCHDNVHGDQFINSGKNDCTQCHSMAESWNIRNFNHDNTLFPLEGKHQDVDCKECHKPKVFEDNVERVNYKIKKFECKDCHSS